MNLTETTKPASLGPDDPRVVRAVEEYVSALETGEHPDREAFLARHAEIRAILAGCLDGLHFIRAARPQLDDGPTAEETVVVAPLGDFRIIGEIGRGGMGIVYEAEQMSLGRRVALKVLPFAATLDDKQILRFKNEAKAAGNLHHPNIVGIHFVGRERGVYFYAMQYIEGQSLAEVVVDRRSRTDSKPSSRSQNADLQKRTDVTQGAAIPSDSSLQSTICNLKSSTLASTHGRAFHHAIARLGMQAALALDYAHEVGVVHRDVKPANLLVGGHGHLWVTDFGLAQMKGDHNLTMSGDLLGTLRYMSPEQALAKRVLVDHRTDIYSLGATLYELLTGEPVVTGADRQELLRQIAFEEPKAPRRHNKAIPAELETIILKALEKNPADRYATAKELAEDLERFVKDEPIKARRPSVVRRVKGWCRKHKPLVAALVSALMLAGGSLFWQERQRATTAQAVEKDWTEAETYWKQKQWAKALPALERATGRLMGSGLEALIDRFETRRTEAALAGRLEEARLRAANPSDGPRDFVGVGRAYHAAFANNGLDVTVLAQEEAVRRIRASAIRNEVVTALDDWAFYRDRMTPGKNSPGEPLRALARLADDDEWRNQLRDPHVINDRAALLRIAAGDAVRAQPPENVIILFHLLGADGPLGSQDPGVRMLLKVQPLHPANYWINMNLAWHMADDPAAAGDAISFYRAALAVQPQNAQLHFILGRALMALNRVPEAEAALLKGTESRGGSDPAAYFQRAWSLLLIEQDSRAIDSLRKAIALNADYPVAINNLGLLLERQGNIAEAEKCFRKLIELRPNDGPGYENLGRLLLGEGRYAEALECGKRGARHDGNALWFVEQCVLLEDRLPKLLKREELPTNANERIVLALLSSQKYNCAASARFFSEAFAEEPDLGNGPASPFRSLAAAAAARAGCGKGNDADKLNADERVCLRQQARAWLRADLVACRLLLESDPDKERTAVRGHLRNWTAPGNWSLNCVRLPYFLAKLPELERREWQALWTEVEELVRRTEAPQAR